MHLWFWLSKHQFSTILKSRMLILGSRMAVLSGLLKNEKKQKLQIYEHVFSSVTKVQSTVQSRIARYNVLRTYVKPTPPMHANADVFACARVPTTSLSQTCDPSRRRASVGHAPVEHASHSPPQACPRECSFAPRRWAALIKIQLRSALVKAPPRHKNTCNLSTPWC